MNLFYNAVSYVNQYCRTVKYVCLKRKFYICGKGLDVSTVKLGIYKTHSAFSSLKINQPTKVYWVTRRVYEESEANLRTETHFRIISPEGYDVTIEQTRRRLYSNVYCRWCGVCFSLTDRSGTLKKRVELIY